jgi:ketosteroid isomerase-like protein
MDSDRSVGHELETGGRKMMRRYCAPMLMAVAVACAGQMRSGPGFSASSDAAAIKAIFDTTAAGWNRGELPVYLSAYVDTATAMGSTGLVRGVQGIEGQMRAGFWRTGRPLQTLSYDHLEIRPIGPDQAIATGQYILTGGGVQNRTGWFSTIWVRTPKGWRMVHDHS